MMTREHVNYGVASHHVRARRRMLQLVQAYSEVSMYTTRVVIVLIVTIAATER